MKIFTAKAAKKAVDQFNILNEFSYDNQQYFMEIIEDIKMSSATGNYFHIKRMCTAEDDILDALCKVGYEIEKYINMKIVDIMTW